MEQGYFSFQFFQTDKIGKVLNEEICEVFLIPHRHFLSAQNMAQNLAQVMFAVFRHV